MEEFHYRIAWRATSAHPGHHRSQTEGGGFEFHGHASLMTGADPRHIDIRASLSNPFGDYQVRQFYQTSIVPVHVIADLSASMGLGHKPELLSRLTTAIAYSAYRTGDPFGFVGIADRHTPSILWPLRRHRGAALTLARQLNGYPFQGRGLDQPLSLTAWLGKRRSLAFLLSDFHFPLSRLQALLQQLRPHDVVPLVLWLSQEWRPPARWGWLPLHDPETGTRRTMWFHPGTEKSLRLAFDRRRRQLTELCRRYGRRPFFVVDGFRPEALSRYFLESCA